MWSWSEIEPTPSGWRSISARPWWCISNSARPPDDVLQRARERGTAMVISPLDSYVSGRMITLAAPCRALMEKEPLTVTPDFLVDDMSEQIKELHYGAAVAVDGDQRPVGLITRSDLVAPAAAAGDPRRPCRAGPERDRDRGGRDPRDPRSPPHRLDRDSDPGHGDLRPGRINRHAGRRALPSERSGTEPDQRADAARRGAVRHGDPQLAHHHQSRPRGRRVPRAGAGPRRTRARARDVRVHRRRLRGQRRGNRHPRRQALSGRG